MAGAGLGHVFGPVPSRRLGASLGLDVVRFKTCSYDCIYCQLGRTTDHCTTAAAAVAPQAVIAEVRRRLAAGARPDYLTFSGSGEPTLYGRLGELIAGLRPLGIPVAVLTNGSLLWRRRIAAACALADLVSPTLVAGSAATWRRVNRPHRSVGFRRMVEGLVGFRRRFRGQLWLEVMLVAGVNDSAAEVGKIAALARRIRPDRVQLNTVVRPPAERFARPVPRGRLERLAALFDPPAEVIADAPRRGQAPQVARQSARSGPCPPTRDAVLAMIRRHPATAGELAAGLRISRAAAERSLAELAAAGLAVARARRGRRYWSAPERRSK
jgi:wyosine [tRNA(Phe)-imidazoG37] synthetase (radical SAM superfamily)